MVGIWLIALIEDRMATNIEDLLVQSWHCYSHLTTNSSQAVKTTFTLAIAVLIVARLM